MNRTSPMSPYLAMAAALLICALLSPLTGCGGGSDSSSSVSATEVSTSAAPPPPPPTNGAPVIKTQPTSVVTTLGATASFGVVASGTSLRYQWYKDGTAISRATRATYTVRPVTTASLGTYWVVVSNQKGSVTSNKVTLSTGGGGGGGGGGDTTPTITTQPSSVVATVGNSAGFTVVASGSGLSYQWYKGGTAVSGATGATYTVSSVATSNIGTYYVTVSNTAGNVTSNSVTLRAVTALGIWGAYEQSGGSAALSSPTIAATGSNESAVWVTNGGSLTLTSPTITTSGNTSSQDSSSFYGLNAGVLASIGTINITGGTVTTTGTGANGVFASGSGASVTLSGVTIKATATGGHAVMATQGGVMNLTNVNMTTAGANSAPIATDRGGGTITVTGGTVTSSGQDSPGIYSTGAITVSGARVTATGAEAAVIEGANSITLTNTALSGALKRGVMIYQSMSGDATGNRGTFTMTGGSLAAAAGPLFYVTNSTGIIKLTGTSLTASSGTLLQAAAGNWGTSGSNGGTANLTASGETLTGNLVCDSISSIAATLQNSTTLTGSINTAALTLDSTSKWYVTANSVLTTLSDSSGISGTSITNIYGNGHTVSYNSSLAGNSALGGKTYTLAGGGYLKPA